MFQKLINWSLREHQTLPWRSNRTLYRTLVSEFMLQQTTVGAVLGHFERFLDLYPNIEQLSIASEEEVLIAWKGLGYYRRAKNLRKAAIDIYFFYEGKIPLVYNDLVNISGIGDYTANALLSIGKNKNTFAIDANIERVLSRLFLLEELKGKPLHQRIKNDKNLNELVTKFGGRNLNEALMDLGRVFCKSNKVQCDQCPVNDNCMSFGSQNVLDYPKEKMKKKAKMFELELLRIVAIEGNSLLAYKKTKGEWLEGQWELPTYITKTNDASLSQFPIAAEQLLKKIDLKLAFEIKSSITKYKITNKVILLDIKEFEKLFSDSKDYKLQSIPVVSRLLGTTCQKILNKVND